MILYYKYILYFSGASIMATVLATSKYLKTVNLGKNDIGLDGMMDIYFSLTSNSVLEKLSSLCFL